MEPTIPMKTLIMVVNAGFAEEVIELARGEGARGATILNARGEGARHESFLGITVDTEKELVMCVVDAGTSEKAMAAVKEKAGIKTPAHSICFTMSVDQVIGINNAVME